MHRERLVIVDGPMGVARAVYVDTAQQIYIRLGHPPIGLTRSERDGRCEGGLSVYRAYREGERYLIDARKLDPQSTCEIAFSQAPCYLAEGPIVGRDSDGEPVMWSPKLHPIAAGPQIVAVILANAH